jgi:hypothetical protein
LHRVPASDLRLGRSASRALVFPHVRRAGAAPLYSPSTYVARHAGGVPPRSLHHKTSTLPPPQAPALASTASPMAAPWSHGSRQAVAIGTVVHPATGHGTTRFKRCRVVLVPMHRHGGTVGCRASACPCGTFGRMSCCMLVPTLINNGVRVSVRKRAVDQPRPEARPHPVYTPTTEHCIWTTLASCCYPLLEGSRRL